MGYVLCDIKLLETKGRRQARAAVWLGAGRTAATGPTLGSTHPGGLAGRLAKPQSPLAWIMFDLDLALMLMVRLNP